EGRAGPPMADDEDGRFDLRARDSCPVHSTLDRVEQRIHEGEEKGRNRYMNAPDRRGHREPVLRQKGKKGRDIHSVPDPADPPRIGIVRATHSPIFRIEGIFEGTMLAPHPAPPLT